MTLLALLLVALQVVVVLAFVAVLGRAGSRIVRQEEWGAVESAALGTAAFVGLSVVFLLLNVVTAGFVFGNPWPVPLLGFGLLVASVARHGWPTARLQRHQVVAGVLFVVVLFGIFVSPMVTSGSSLRTGDPPWHLGWTEQMLGGEQLPLGPAPEFARNGYPWGHHALLATITRLVPGTTTTSSHNALHVLLVLGIPMAAAALARAIDRRAGWPAAVAVSLLGGWGFIQARSAAFDVSPTEARFGADLVAASPNSLYELFPPALPREVGLVLLGVFGALLLRCLPGTRALRLSAGVTLGLIGLVSVPMGLHAALWLGVLLLVRARRWEFVRDVMLPGAAVFSVWAAPMMIDAFRLGGLVNVSPALGREWPVTTALWSWGLLLPLAAAGVVLLMRHREERSRVLLAIAGASTLLLCVSLARKAFEWSLSGQSTLLHQGRMWPALHLLAAVAAGVAVAWFVRRAPARSQALTVTGLSLLLLIGTASPWLASRGLSRVMEEGRGGFGYGVPGLRHDGFVRSAAAHMGPGEVVLVEGSDELAFFLFQFSGVRLATFDDGRLEGNDLRIRFRDLARSYDERANGDGFVPDWLVIRSEADLGSSGRRPPRSVLSGTFEAEEWTLYRSTDPPDTT